MKRTPKAKKCRNTLCGKSFVPDRPMQNVCSPLCGIALARKQREKKQADKAKAERKDLRERKRKLKTRGDHEREAQQAFNAYIRARDKAAGHACISSGRPLDWSGNNVDAGHWRSVGSAPHLRFEENNCHAQSKHDNRYLSGNPVDYRLGLIERIGLAAVEALETDQEPRRYRIDDLEKIKAKYRRLKREIERGEI